MAKKEYYPNKLQHIGSINTSKLFSKICHLCGLGNQSQVFPFLSSSTYPPLEAAEQIYPFFFFLINARFPPPPPLVLTPFPHICLPLLFLILSKSLTLPRSSQLLETKGPPPHQISQTNFIKSFLMNKPPRSPQSSVPPAQSKCPPDWEISFITLHSKSQSLIISLHCEDLLFN